jgi:hypothetical protein
MFRRQYVLRHNVLGVKRPETKRPETIRPVDKTSCGQNAQRDIMSSGTKPSQGRNVLGTKQPLEKMSSGTKCPEKKHPSTLNKRPVTTKKLPNTMKKKWRILGLFSCIRYSKTYMMLYISVSIIEFKLF